MSYYVLLFQDEDEDDEDDEEEEMDPRVRGIPQTLLYLYT